MTKSAFRIPAGTTVNPADFTRTLRRIKVPVNFTPEAVMIPGAWADLHDKIHIDDELIVWPEDRAWRLHLLVVGKMPGLVETIELHRWVREGARQTANEPASDLEVPEGYIVNHAPKTGWRVLTKDPHLEVSRNHPSKNAAIAAAVAHAMRATGVAA